MKNLPKNATEEELKKRFGNLGVLTDVKVIFIYMYIIYIYYALYGCIYVYIYIIYNIMYVYEGNIHIHV